MNHYECQPFGSAADLASAAAAAWLEGVADSIRAGATHTIALSGGRIAREFYAAIVNQARPRNLDFASVHFFWADERCVPPSDPESNYRLAQELVLAPLAVPSSNIHRILGEEPPEFAALEAEAEISRIADLNADGLPMLDLVILGLGEDGHVASLFPGAGREVTESRHSYLAIAGSPKPPACRITLSYAALRAARQVWVLASGPGKRTALQDSLAPTGTTPLARVIKSRKVTRLFSDIP